MDKTWIWWVPKTSGQSLDIIRIKLEKNGLNLNKIRIESGKGTWMAPKI